MHTRSGLDVSPVRGDSPSSTDKEADAGRSVRKVSRCMARKAQSVSKVRNIKEGHASSSKVPRNISVKKYPMKNVPKQQGINAQKTKGNSSTEPFQHRFLVHRIRELKFTEEQIGWINDAEFGSLLAMSDICMPAKLVSWIMKNINPDLREFRIKKKVLDLTSNSFAMFLACQVEVSLLRLVVPLMNMKRTSRSVSLLWVESEVCLCPSAFFCRPMGRC